MLLGPQGQPITPEQEIRMMFHSCYLSLIPIVTAKRMDSGIPNSADPDAIADEACEIAQAALRRLNVEMRVPRNLPPRQREDE